MENANCPSKKSGVKCDRVGREIMENAKCPSKKKRCKNVTEERGRSLSAQKRNHT